MQSRIAVVGSLNMDLIARVPHLPRPGETVIARDFHTAPGGKGANQAVAAAKLGASVAMIGRVGGDTYGNVLLNNLRQAGVEVEHVIVDPEAVTGMALITLDDAGQNTITVVSGANMRLSTEDIDAAEGIIRSSQVLLLQLESPLPVVRHAVASAWRHGITVVLNPAPARPLPQEILERADYLIPNESEASLLSGVEVTDLSTAQAAARKLHQQGAKSVVLTLGEKGAFLADGKVEAHIPGFRVEVVDTTAAGDAFVAAFAVALASGQELKEAVRFANGAGALTVTKLGAQPSLPTYQEVATLLTVASNPSVRSDYAAGLQGLHPCP